MSSFRSAVKPSQILTVSQVAQELQISERTVYDLVRTGKLPAFRYLSTYWRIRRQDLDAFCDPANKSGTT